MGGCPRPRSMRRVSHRSAAHARCGGGPGSRLTLAALATTAATPMFDWLSRSLCFGNRALVREPEDIRCDIMQTLRALSSLQKFQSLALIL